MPLGFGVLGGTYLRETVDLFLAFFRWVGSSIERVSFGPLIRIQWTKAPPLLSNPSHPLPPLTLPTPLWPPPPPSLPLFPILAADPLARFLPSPLLQLPPSHQTLAALTISSSPRCSHLSSLGSPSSWCKPLIGELVGGRRKG
jgi:hypothetical protein